MISVMHAKLDQTVYGKSNIYILIKRRYSLDISIAFYQIRNIADVDLALIVRIKEKQIIIYINKSHHTILMKDIDYALCMKTI